MQYACDTGIVSIVISSNQHGCTAPCQVVSLPVRFVYCEIARDARRPSAGAGSESSPLSSASEPYAARPSKPADGSVAAAGALALVVASTGADGPAGQLLSPRVTEEITRVRVRRHCRKQWGLSRNLTFVCLIKSVSRFVNLPQKANETSGPHSGPDAAACSDCKTSSSGMCCRCCWSSCKRIDWLCYG